MAGAPPRRTESTAEDLARFLRSEVGLQDVAVTIDRRPEGSGFSSDTVVFVAQHHTDGDQVESRFVARVAPPPQRSLYPNHDLGLQWSLLRELGASTDLPIPRVVGPCEETGRWIGAPFFLMERIDGTAPSDSPPYTVRGWVHDASDDDQRQIHLEGFDLLARIHDVDWTSSRFDFLRARLAEGSQVESELAADVAFHRWVVRDRSFDVVDRAFRWLHDHLPDHEELVLSWGDARLGNILYRDLRPVAILDWEMAGIAAADADVAWWSVFEDIHTVGINRPRLPGAPAPEELVDRYRSATGRELAHLPYYRVRAAVRAALLLIRHTDVLVELGTIESDAVRKPYDAALTVLRSLLGD